MNGLFVPLTMEGSQHVCLFLHCDAFSLLFYTNNYLEIFWVVTNWGMGGSTAIYWIETRDITKHSMMYKEAPQQKVITCPKHQ